MPEETTTPPVRPDGRTRSRRPRNRDKMRTSKLAVASMVFLLLNVLIWTSLRLREVIITSGLSTLCALIGFILGMVALSKIHRRQGRLEGEGAATLGKWANLGLLVVSGLLFAYSLTLAIMRGQILN